MEELEAYEKVARMVVEEVNSVDRLNSMLELGMRLTANMSRDEVASFGFGCGGNCDAWGIGCGNNCLTGLGPTDIMIEDRYAIDVFGKKDLKTEEMIAMRKDFGKFQEAVTAVVTERLSLQRMEERIKKYGR